MQDAYSSSNLSETENKTGLLCGMLWEDIITSVAQLKWIIIILYTKSTLEASRMKSFNKLWMLLKDIISKKKYLFKSKVLISAFLFSLVISNTF